MEGTASSRRLAANILNKQPRTNDKGWSSSLGVGHGANNPRYEKLHKVSDLDECIQNLCQINGVDLINIKCEAGIHFMNKRKELVSLRPNFIENENDGMFSDDCANRYSE
jgi:hypothetical protein